MVKTLRFSLFGLLMLLCGSINAAVENVDFTTLEITKTDDGFTLESGNYAFTAVKNNGQTAPTQNNRSKDIRLYAKNTITVNSTNAMQKMVFAISTAGLKRQAEITPSVGTMTYDMDNSQVTWTADAPVAVVDFTVGDKNVYGSEAKSKAGQFDFNSVEITTDEGGAVVEAPAFSVPGGIYTTPQTVTLTAAAGCTIHYTIDGTQDIIWGRATAEETLYGYSARFFRYEEHKDDIPNIALKHLLTRLQFQVETGASTENGGEPFPDAEKVSVKSIAIRDAISGVDLVVADLARRSPSAGMQMSERLEIREPQETAEFTLRESDDSDEPMTPVPLPTELGTQKRVGGSIMLVPAGEYLLKVILHKDGDGPEDPGTDLETEKSLKVESIVESEGQKTFNPGVSYMVTIKVNDFKEVDAQAKLSDWQNSTYNPPTVEL